MLDPELLHGPLKPIHREMERPFDVVLEGDRESEVLVFRGLPNRCAVNILALEPPAKAVELWRLQLADSFEVSELHCDHEEELFVLRVGLVVGFEWTAGLDHFVDLRKACLKPWLPILKLLDNSFGIVFGSESLREFSSSKAVSERGHVGI